MNLCDLVPGERAGDRKRRLAQAAELASRKEAAKHYNSLIAERERLERQKVPMHNAMNRRIHAEATVARIEIQLASLEQQAVADFRYVKLIRPAREDLEIAREILARTMAAEGVERARYEALIAATDAPVAKKQAE